MKKIQIHKYIVGFICHFLASARTSSSRQPCKISSTTVYDYGPSSIQPSRYLLLLLLNHAICCYNYIIHLFFAERCKRNQFRCNDGTCIPLHWRCDSNTDCKDGTDELLCSNQGNCAPEQFQCSFTRHCIPSTWKCDGEFDCSDRSDEDSNHCKKEITCPWNQAPCNGTLECRPLKVFCDGNPDCPNRSDEWEFCVNNSSDCLGLRCMHACAVTPSGPKCYCPDGQKPKGSQCVDANECELDGTCSQICTNTDGSFTCSCVSGYNKNGSDCLAVNGK